MKTAFNKKTLSGVLATSLFLATPLVSMAGIGDINVRSSLGEPLAAIIPLSGEEAQLAAQQPDSVSVSSQAPIGVRVAENNGNTVLVVRSRAPINQSILIMNVNVGSSQKPYVVLLDPPKVDAQASSSAKTKTSSSKKGDKTESTAQSNVGSSNVGLGQRYTVVPNDTVISLARQLQTPNVSLKQTMNAIVAKNPHAFIGGDPNKLKNGATITLPTESELKRAPAVVKPKTKPTADKKEDTPSVVAEPVQQVPKQEPVVEPKPAPAPAPVVEQPKPVEPPKPVEQPKPEAPAPVVEEPVASAEQQATEIVEEKTSEVVIADEASVVAPQEEVVAPQVDKTKTPKVVTASDSESSDGGLLSLLPYIVGGLGLLLLLLWLLTRGKKKPQKTKPNRTKVDDLVTSPNVYTPKKEPVAPVAKEVKEDASNVAVAAAAAAPVVMEELEDDDDITFNAAEKVQEAASSVSDALSNIDLNLKDSEQEEVEENKFASDYEEKEVSATQTTLGEVVDAVKETTSKVTETVQEKFENAVEAVKDFVDPEVDTAPTFEEVSFEAAPIVDEQPVVQQESVDFVQEETFAEPEEVSTFAEEFVEQPESRHAKSVEDQLAEGEKQKLAFDSSINLDLGFGDFSQESTSNEIEDVKTYEPSPLPKLDDDFGLAQEQETVAESVAFVEQPVEQPVAEVEPYVQEEVVTATENVVQEESVPEEVQQIVTRVNENVVKDADTPLAAKLELAKMYLSMEDNDGAVETLYDILDQADQSSALYQEAEELLRSVVQTA